MRANICWIILHVCIWAGLLLTLNADDECYIEVQVHVNTSYKAVVGEQLEIECKVVFCEEAQPTVDWIKPDSNQTNISSSSHIQTQWKPINKSEGLSILVFPNIRLNDSGEYQCKSGDSSSHYINVFVNVDDGRGRTTVPQKNESSTNSEPTVNSWTYMYFAAGIVPFIIIPIIISVVLMCRCQGESKNETQTEVQYIAIPAEKPIPHGSLQPSPRRI
ncbi:B- and T-lymphocyte attenuator-like [Trematomus bernacchii]|uniref:B- and T-lymphocyte attenuator-like n=1 Tax=Trematomus bernacchii TaxID=40690 RepID=UPI00146E4014|nr:B- and T-lymphocyte attenuator-like [Trematomus bernacchii]